MTWDDERPSAGEAGRFVCGYCQSVRYTTLQTGPRSLAGKTICDGCRRTHAAAQFADICVNGT